MNSYQVSFIGKTPLIMHRDNLYFSEKIAEWQKLPENKELSKAGDDRSPAWTWIGSLYYHKEGRDVICMDSDNLMTVLREGGAKVRTGKKQETYKKQTQSGLVIPEIESTLLVHGKEIPMAPIRALNGETNFMKHMELAEELGFELFVKRARIKSSKHVRVRPMFRDWEIHTQIDVLNEEVSGITKEILTRILQCAGEQCGLCDWRPSSRTPGSYGKFSVEIKEI